MANSGFEKNNYLVVEPTFPHKLLVDLNRLYGGKKGSLQDEEYTIRCYKEKYPDRVNELLLLKLAYEQGIIKTFFEIDGKQEWQKRVFIEKSFNNLVKVVQEKQAVILLESLMFLFRWNISLKITRKRNTLEVEQAHFHELTKIKQIEAARILEKIKTNHKINISEFTQSKDRIQETEPIQDDGERIPSYKKKDKVEKKSTRNDVPKENRTNILSDKKKTDDVQWKKKLVKVFEVLNQKPEQVKFYKMMNTKKRRVLAKALGGDSLSQCEMGDYYADPNSKHLDYKEAIRWYEVSAEKGFERALFEMGKIYDMNLPEIPSKKEEALKIYTKLAEQGFPTAQCVLGMKYRFGDGVKEDIGAARRWLYKAAVQRHEAAIRNLADLFFSLHDTENAKKWYQIGAANGDEYCKRRL